MSKYTTGEMAKLCNVSVRTVQFYDAKGVLHPSDLTEGGRRIYNGDDLTKLRLICALKAIGLSLDSIKSVMESELSKKILTILLDEQVKLLSGEIDERQKQLEMIIIIKENIRDKAVVPANTIIDVEHIMEKKNKTRNTKKLALIYLAVGIGISIQFLFLAWLITSRIWWALGVYALFAVFGVIISLLVLKDFEFICSNCDAVFKPSLRRVFFTTGDNKVRWMTCPECRHTNWCIMRNQKLTK
ncbi:MAG: MerR family transcriptional regulator [Oscillospiraceae bacterium]|nr:MerR family transcriptional regulator [Oscillospiraceae bacterium]